MYVCICTLPYKQQFDKSLKKIMNDLYVVTSARISDTHDSQLADQFNEVLLACIKVYIPYTLLMYLYLLIINICIIYIYIYLNIINIYKLI